MSQQRDQQQITADRLQQVKAKTNNSRLKEAIEKKQDYINNPKIVRK